MAPMSKHGKLGILFVLQLEIVKGIAGQISGTQFNTQQEIVYDVTGLSRDDLNKTSDMLSMVYIVGHYDKNLGITSPSLLVTLDRTIKLTRFKHDTTTNVIKNHGSTIHSIIMQLDDPYNVEHDLTDALYMVEAEKQELHFPVKFGLEYGERVMKHLSRIDFLQDFATFRLGVLRVELSPHKDLLSYGLFSEKLDALVHENRWFVDKINSEFQVYIRLVFQRFPNISDQANIRFSALIFDYVKAWKEERNGTEIIIIEPLKSVNIALQTNNEFLRDHLIAAFYEGLPKSKEFIDLRIQGLPFIVKNLIVVFPNPPLNTTRILSSLRAISSLIKTNFSISVPFDSNFLDVSQLVTNIPNHFHINTIYFLNASSGTSSWNLSAINEFGNLLDRENVQVGCIVTNMESDFSPVSVEDIKKGCGPLVNVSSKIVYSKIMEIQGTEELIHDLESLEQERRLFEEEFPGKEVNPFIFLNKSGPALNTMYCSTSIRKYEEYYNTIIAFANIHDWPNLYLRPLISDGFYDGMWHFIKHNEDIKQVFWNAPVYVRTNGAKSIGKDEHFPYTYPCVQWTENKPQKEIGFLKNGYSGTTVNMDLRPQTELNAKELETLLLFAFGKFPTVDLVAKSGNDVIVASQVLTDNFLSHVSRFNEYSSESHHVHLEIPIELAYHSANIFKKLTMNVAVHLSGWENNARGILNHINFNTLGKRHIGITVQDCVKELNLNLTRIAALPILPIVKYIVCDVKSIWPDNSRKDVMDKYLNSMFYIKTFVQKSHPEMSVYFRLSMKDDPFLDAKRTKAERILKFVNDVHQHGKAYKVRYFIVNAFEKEERRDKSSYSWWRIDNYTNLSNPSVYTDIENDFFDRETKLPPRPATNGNERKSGINVITVIVVSVLSVLLFLSFLALWINRNRMNKTLLTLQEIHEFHNGTLDNDSDVQSEDHSRWLGMGFPETFQIAKNRIEIGRKIGAGEFGQVFIGMLDQQIEVAVKEPRHNSSVETFKSALSEVKILRFVGDGSHSNVISFLGAYTKEISEGKLYVLTEYCQNGSLFDYLKALQPKAGVAANSSFDLHKLCTFAFEIASGMAFIAEKKVIHGDLATRNVLLTSDYTCKIADFGLSRKLYEYTKYVKKSQQPLPWKWMAVESLKNMEFTTKSDVWSYGITIWEIFSLGASPYPGLAWTIDYAEQLVGGMRLRQAEYATDTIHEMLLKCWSLEPETRPTFGELAQYFADLKGESDTYTTLLEVDSNLVAESKM